MTDGFGEVYVGTRRQLRGVAESVDAGPPDGVYEIVDPLPRTDVDALTSHIADFFQRGRKELCWRNSTATSANPDYR